MINPEEYRLSKNCDCEDCQITRRRLHAIPTFEAFGDLQAAIAKAGFTLVSYHLPHGTDVDPDGESLFLSVIPHREKSMESVVAKRTRDAKIDQMKLALETMPDDHPMREIYEAAIADNDFDPSGGSGPQHH